MNREAGEHWSKAEQWVVGKNELDFDEETAEIDTLSCASSDDLDEDEYQIPEFVEDDLQEENDPLLPNSNRRKKAHAENVRTDTKED